MKIKTVVDYVPDNFDAKVNKFLEDGYILDQRGLLPPDRNGQTAHYAQMVLPDPPAEPETVDPFPALHQVREFCHNVPAGACSTDKCPLNEWCQQLRNGGDPTDWILPDPEERYV